MVRSFPSKGVAACGCGSVFGGSVPSQMFLKAHRQTRRKTDASLGVQHFEPHMRLSISSSDHLQKNHLEVILVSADVSGSMLRCEAK